MGCVGSTQQEGQAKPTETHRNLNKDLNNSNISPKQSAGTQLDLQPKVGLMADHTMKLLKEIGELKTFTEIDTSDINLNQFSDFIMALENPQAGSAKSVKTHGT